MTEGKQWDVRSAEPQAPAFKPVDFVYALFRHQRLILGFFLAGLAAATVVFFVKQPLYTSEAKLLLKYIVDTRSSVVTGTGSRVTTESQSENIINSEMEIFYSLDLCEEAALLADPEKVLAKSGGGTNLAAAASLIRSGLKVENPNKSNIMKVRFSHPDPFVCQLVLRHVVDSYFKRHKAIHIASGNGDVLSEQANTLLVRIRQNEEKLRNLKARAGVISVEDSKKSLGEQSSRLRSEIFASEAMLAEYRAILGMKSSTTGDKKVASQIGAPPEKIAEYKSVMARLDLLRNKEFDLRSEFTAENPQMKRVRDQIAEYEMRRNTLEADYTNIVSVYVAQPLSSPLSPAEARPDPARVVALERKIDVLTNQLAIVRSDVTALDDLEASTADVERTLKLDKENYMHFAAGLQNNIFDEALNAGKISNIQPIQTPSPAVPNSLQRLKFLAAAFVGPLVAGLVLAFLIDFFVDHTVRRPADLEAKLHIPLFLSIPQLSMNGHAKLLPWPGDSPPPTGSVEPATGLKTTWEPDHPLRPFVDGLRDRTLIHFDGDPHKPKLIGVTSCSGGVGVTSLAAGLAGALSETGDGNVLLLHLNVETQSVHPFYRGELTCDLSDVLKSEKRQNGMVLHNLYVASAGNATDADAGNLPKQLSRFVPKLRVSDYDYIVFDLPPTTPTTMTARLAGMMDLVMLVVESEKDTLEAVKQAATQLSRSKARVSTVLNKVRNPLPPWLHKPA